MKPSVWIITVLMKTAVLNFPILGLRKYLVRKQDYFTKFLGEKKQLDKNEAKLLKVKLFSCPKKPRKMLAICSQTNKQLKGICP